MNEQISLSTQLLDALLLDYATGTLSPALEVLVETHLAMNPHSAETMQMLMNLLQPLVNFFLGQNVV